MDPLPGFQNQSFCLCLFGAGRLFLALFFGGLFEDEYFAIGAHFVRYVAVARDSVFPRWVFARAREGLAALLGQLNSSGFFDAFGIGCDSCIRINASPVYARACSYEGAERWMVWV